MQPGIGQAYPAFLKSSLPASRLREMESPPYPAIGHSRAGRWTLRDTPFLLLNLNDMDEVVIQIETECGNPIFAKVLPQAYPGTRARPVRPMSR